MEMAEPDLILLGTMVKRLQEDVRTLSDDSRIVQVEVSALLGRLDALQRRLEAGFEITDDRLKRLEQRMLEVTGEFAGIQAHFKHVHETMARNLEIVLAAIARLQQPT
jgi:hypothetical protein